MCRETAAIARSETKRAVEVFDGPDLMWTHHWRSSQLFEPRGSTLQAGLFINNCNPVRSSITAAHPPSSSITTLAINNCMRRGGKAGHDTACKAARKPQTAELQPLYKDAALKRHYQYNCNSTMWYLLGTPYHKLSKTVKQSRGCKHPPLSYTVRLA